MRNPVPATLSAGSSLFLLSLVLWMTVAFDPQAAERGSAPIGFYFQETKGEGKASDEGVTKPEIVSKTNPKYPADAKKEGVAGEVKVDISIGTDGEVIEAKAVNEVDERLAKAAVDAVKLWKFKPAVDKNGKAVKVKATITVRFALK